MIRPWITFAIFSLPVLVLGGLVAWFFAQSTDLDSSTETMMSGDKRGQELLEVARGLISKEVMAGILVEHPNWVSDEGAWLSNQIVLELEDLDGAIEVRSLTTTLYPGLDGKKPVLKNLMPLRVANPADWEGHRRFMTSHPLSKNFILSEDGKVALFLAFFKRPMDTHAQRRAFRSEIQKIAHRVREEPGVENVDLLGLELAQAEIVELFLDEGRRYGLGFLLLASIVMIAVFRNPLICFLLIGYLLYGLGVLAAVFWLNDHLPNLYTAILLPLVLGLQLTFLAHLFSAWRRRLVAGEPQYTALAEALREVLVPSGIAATTTVIGLLSLLMSPVVIVRQIGLFGAEAVTLMFLGTFLPALVMRFVCQPERVPAEPAVSGRPAPWLGRWGPAVVILLAALAALPGLLRLTPDIRAMEFLSRDTDTYKAAHLINERMGGLYMFVLDLEFDRPFGAQELPMLQFQEQLRLRISDIEGVGEAYGYSQIFTLLNYELKKGEADYSTLPGIFSMFLVKTTVNTMNFPYKSQLQNADASRVSMFVRSADMPSQEYLPMINEVMATAQEMAPEGVTVTARQGVQSFFEGQQEMVDSLSRTLVTSVLAVLLCLTLLWQSFRCGLAGVLVVVPPLLVMGGLMGYLGVSLNAITVMLGALLLGIAVDDAVHVIDLFRHHRHRFETSRAAAAWAVRRKLLAMSCTTAVLVSLFAMLAFSAFPPVASFGLLAVIALLAALLSAVFLLPVVLACLHPRPPSGPPA